MDLQCVIREGLFGMITIIYTDAGGEIGHGFIFILTDADRDSDLTFFSVSLQKSGDEIAVDGTADLSGLFYDLLCFVGGQGLILDLGSGIFPIFVMQGIVVLPVKAAIFPFAAAITDI